MLTYKSINLNPNPNTETEDVRQLGVGVLAGRRKTIEWEDKSMTASICIIGIDIYSSLIVSYCIQFLTPAGILSVLKVIELGLQICPMHSGRDSGSSVVRGHIAS